MEFNLFRFTIFTLFVLGYFFLSGGQSEKQKRAPVPTFIYNAADWPSLAPSTTQTGYTTTPQPWSQKSFTSSVLSFNLKSDASWNIAVNKESDLLVKCPTGNFGSAGSCWWTCGGGDTKRPGLDGWNCYRSTDMTQCVASKSWALTFDDGPGPSSLDLLKILQQNNLKGTFFMVGSHMVQYPDIVRQLYNAGMELGVHTWSHHPLTTLSNDVIIAELMWTMKAFYDILGVVPKYFRPPMGDIDDRVRSIVNQMGLITVIWNVDTQDYTTDGNTGLIPSVEASFNAQVSVPQSTLNTNYPFGIITLEHDYFEGGVTLFTSMVQPQLQKSGYGVLSLKDCIGISSGLLIDSTTTPPPPPPPAVSPLSTTVPPPPVTSPNAPSPPPVAPNPPPPPPPPISPSPPPPVSSSSPTVAPNPPPKAPNPPPPPPPVYSSPSTAVQPNSPPSNAPSGSSSSASSSNTVQSKIPIPTFIVTGDCSKIMPNGFRFLFIGFVFYFLI